MKNNGVIFLKDWKVLVSSLSPENQLVFWDLFTEYEYGCELACENPIVYPVWNFIKSQMDKMKDRYQDKVVQRNKVNGSKGGRPKKEPNETQDNPTPICSTFETQTNQNNPVGFYETQKSHNEKNNEKDNNNENDILLEKETKGENQDFPITQNEELKISDDKDLEALEKEKSSAKKEKKFFSKVEFRKRLIEFGAVEKHIDDWFKVRDKKRASYTESALDGLLNECKKNNYPVAEAVRNCAENSWQGFKYDWLTQEEKNKNGESNNQSTENRSSNTQGDTKRGFNRKVSARAILASGGFDEVARNSESRDNTIEAEVVES